MKVRKCDACIAFRQAGKNPVCVDACPMRALDFGDTDELKSKYGSAVVSELPCMPDGGTGQNVLVKPKDCTLEDAFRSVII